MRNIILGLLLIISIVLVFLKIHFEYYHFLFPIILIYTLWKFELRKKKSVGRKILVGGLLNLVISLLFIPDSFLYKKINSDQYYWTEQKLKVNHFKGKPDNTSEHTATVF
ncbi:MAG: hypothetical protein ABI263_00765, partial [Gelidibacter sp.]